MTDSDLIRRNDVMEILLDEGWYGDTFGRIEDIPAVQPATVTVEQAARVLLDAMPVDFGHDGPRWVAASAAERSLRFANAYTERQATIYHAFRAALRALAGEQPND